MHIKKISIENFQCYCGPQSENKFEFSKGVNIVAGRNGSGKSKLFNALYWTLFGTIYSKIENDWVETKKIGHRYISNRAKKQFQDDGRVKCSVQIILDAPNFESGNKFVQYTFSRKIVIEMQSGTWQIVTPETLEISYKKDTGETEYVDRLKNQTVIDYVFPPGIRKYMWFQGEAIDSLLDFNKPNTLRAAIKNISYYPYYVNLHKITSETNELLTKSIGKHLRKSKKADQKLNQILTDIEKNSRKLKSIKKDIDNEREKHDEIKAKIHETETALKNYDGFKEFEKKLTDIEHRDDKITWQISNLESEYREKFVTKWMLKGADDLIKKADGVLEEFSKVIREKSKTDNPIPLKIPGKKYIQQMLDDTFCHICERPAPKDSKAYKAMKKRLLESKDLEAEAKEKDRIYKELEMSYMYLADKPNQILDIVSGIEKDIQVWAKKMDDLFEGRRECAKDKERLESETDIKEIKKGARTAANLTKDYTFYKEEEKKQSNYIKRLERERILLKGQIDSSTKERKKYESDDEKIIEQEAEIYFKLLESISLELKDRALINLLKDIESKANDLYKKYLENSQSPDGYLRIDPETYEVLVLDDGKRKDINQGHEAAAKMSVINAILSLSSDKLGKSYPLVADAPSSVLDRSNTKSYTEKISETFDQVILISKDYSTEMDMEFLKEIEEIKRVYKIENRIINKKLAKSESNNRTFIELVKPN